MEGVMLVPIVHTVHVLAVGAWLGGVLFTTLVVSPALKAMKWREAERVGCGPLSGTGTRVWVA
jgi:putative copper export protein